ncbi:MAG: hypothetical protein JWR83_891 [Aeromicrobium sp.]|nr:hypothetical protein [Aeromicrobium sp.]
MTATRMRSGWAGTAVCLILGKDESVELSLQRRVQQPWTLEVPISLAEVSERLTSCTSADGYRWFLSPTNAAQPSPAFRGTVTGQHIHVARFDATLGRNSFVAWLDADMRESPSGGARLDGTIGLASGWSFLWPWMLLGNAVLFGGWIAFAVNLLLSNRPLQAVPLIVIPIVALTGEAIGLRAGLRSMRADVTKLKVALADALR